MALGEQPVERILDFFDAVSRKLMADPAVRQYQDVVTFAFWVRKANTHKLRERFFREDGDVRLGRGTAFHIAPSNVPVNYAYSFAAGMLAGNANIVRVPSKDFPQIGLINGAVNASLEDFEDLRPYVCFVRYGRDREVNDLLSMLADTRIVWGGDATIAEIRRSPLRPRAGEITFADRFSIAVVDSGAYLAEKDKARIAEEFYNDTYLTDQNACTSPRLVVWMGEQKEEAKKEFWERLHAMVERRYRFQTIQGVNKLVSAYLAAALMDGVQIGSNQDNLLVRTKVLCLQDGIMDLKDNCGYFFEYDCGDILELRGICNDRRCQTIAYIGEKEMFRPLLACGVKGIDRVVPVGKTMDFDLIWDGYDLCERLTRVIRVMD